MAHAARVVVEEQRQRSPVFGVDPKLILVVETTRPIPEEEFRPAELRVLDASSRELVVAFASDPRLSAFLERLSRYSEGVTGDRSTAPFEGFFDAVVGVRRYGPRDRLTERAEAALSAAESTAAIAVDIECWFPGLEESALAWVNEIEGATRASGGTVVDRYLNGSAGIVLVRVEATPTAIRELAELDAIATIDALPVPALSWSDAANLSISDLPAFDPPDPDAPLVAVVDSGVRSAHPLLRGAVYDAIPGAGLSSGEDRHGHGTAVGALLLHGELEQPLARGFLPRPLMNLLSIRVLDDNNEFPLGTLWIREVEDAIKQAADLGARIVNLSIGDASTPFRGPKSTPVAAVLDQLARELGVVLVVSAGNVHVPDYLSSPRREDTETYTSDLVSNEDTGILDPAPAALALTIGALVGNVDSGDLQRSTFGEVSWPSPFTCTGPGIGNSIKPELVAPGGSIAIDLTTEDLLDVDNLAVLSADGSGRPGALLSANTGTSFAAPLVARVAAAIRSEYPHFDSNLIRALVLQAAEEVDADFPVGDDSAGARHRKALQRHLVGYGRPALSKAIHSNDHRAVLVASDEIEVDGVHLYEIPIPDSFFESGGERGITIALAYSPETRSRRLDYLASRMKFELVRGIPPDEVPALFLAEPDGADNEGDDAADEADGSDPDSDDSIDDQSVSRPRNRLSDLRRTERPPLTPSGATRSAGANQLGRLVFRRALRRDDGDSFLLVVQNTNRWAIQGTREPYGLALALWRSEGQAEIYAELEAELQARLRVPVEAELEAGAA